MPGPPNPPLTHPHFPATTRFLSVVAEQHPRGTEHGFFAIAGGRAGAQLLAEGNLRDIAHRDRHAVAARHDDALDGGDVRHLAGRTDQELLAVLLDVAGAAVDRKSVVSGKGVSVRLELGGRRILKKKNTTK